VGVSKYRGIVSPAYIVQRLRGELRPEYFHYLFRTPGFAKEAERWSYGITSDQWSLRPQHFKMIYSCVPPYDEQDAIVRFLQSFDKKVRRFIRNRRRLIEVLNEQKQAIINRAVTRGLDPDVLLKPSGIDWRGDIPEHWQVVQLRRRWSVTDCKHLTVPFTQEGIPLVSIREVQSFDLNLANCKRTNRDWYEELIEGDRAPRRGDLIYCRNVSVGACAYVNVDTQLAMGQDVCLIRSRSENQRFLNYFLHSGAMDQQLAKVLVGSTFNRINVSEIKSLMVVLPPRSEQDSIVEYLDAELNDFHRPLEIAQQEINLIREYRTRLISDVVTGKVDVRHLAPPPGSEDSEEMAEALEPLAEDPADAVLDEERVNGPD
jgi:type I restriction enzyme S subunit